MPELPFDIRAQLADRRGSLHLIAERDGRPLRLAKYTPGDVSKRRATAKEWAADEALRNGKLLTEAALRKALERAELDALPVIEDQLSEDKEEVVGVATASYVDDDLIVELAWNSEADAPDLIRCDRRTQEISRASHIEVNNALLCPPRAWRGVVTPGFPLPGCVFVPTACDESGEDEAQLRADILQFISDYVELPGDTALVCVEYIFLCWIYDQFCEVPYLAFRTSDLGRGKSRALLTVGSLTYRAMIAGGGSSAPALRRLLDTYRGVLVCDEFDLARDSELTSTIVKVLNQGFEAGRPLVLCEGEDNSPHPYHIFGPKLVVLRGRLGDDASESRFLSVYMKQRQRPDIPLSLPRREFEDRALRLRNRLLGWRFRNYGRHVVDPSHADPRLEDRSNQLLLPLTAIARSEKARARIVKALLEQEGRIAADRSDSLPGEILHTILRLAKLGGSVRPGDVAKAINSQRAEVQGVDVDKLPKDDRVSPNKVGWVIKTVLELPRDRDETGTRYKLDRGRVEQLCERYGVPSETLPALQDCQLPSELPAENTLFETENADSGNHGNHGNVAGVCQAGGEDCHGERTQATESLEDVPF
ncbi:MAG: hypothetical protein JSU86_03030 [Phycisphaerales bacterium]|nr:MAG: hypothetical protein JSU86_03030 [Phycisphaerales bacterium]